MKPFFTLEDYKRLLSNYRIYEGDKVNRKNYINQHYSDEYLSKILVETQVLLMDIFGKINMGEKETFFYRIELNEVIGLSNGCLGGENYDYVFSLDYEPVYYSKRLIEEYLGKDYVIDMYDDVIEGYNEEEEVGSIIFVPYLSIVGPGKKNIKKDQTDVKSKIKV